MTVAAEAEKPVVGTHRKPPFLRRVQIRNYKSIKFCDVTLEPLTVFVGRNGSGKSNFLDALAFLRHVILMGKVYYAVQIHGGYERIVRNGDTSLPIEFEIDAELPHQSESIIFRYKLSIELADSGEYRFAYESMNIDEDGTSFDAINVDSQPTSRSDEIKLFRISNPLAISFADQFADSAIFNFLASEIRKPVPIGMNNVLNSSGNNLPRVLDSKPTRDKIRKDRVVKYISSIMPNIDDFDVVSLGDEQTIRFKMTSFDSNEPKYFYASSMSDGTLRILAILVAAFQVSEKFPRGFIAIEEPETSLHPGAMHAVVDALEDAANSTQVLLTTHSTELLDNSCITPENVRVVEMINGETVITPVDEASLEIVKHKLDTLGGLERQNQLEINQSDLKRQRTLSAESVSK